MTIEPPPSHARPSVIATLLLIVGAVGFMAIFFGLYWLLGVGMVWPGLLFLVYWAAIQRQDFAEYVPAVLGGLAGIVLGWLLIGLPPLIGLAGSVVSLGILAAVLFCFMRGHARLVVNNALMLYLTVSTIANFNLAATAPEMVKSLLLGAAYMGGVAGIVHLITTRRAGRATPAGAI